MDLLKGFSFKYVLLLTDIFSELPQIETRNAIELCRLQMPVSENLSVCLLPQSSGMVPHCMITVWNWLNTRFLTSNYLLKKN